MPFDEIGSSLQLRLDASRVLKGRFHLDCAPPTASLRIAEIQDDEVGPGTGKGASHEGRTDVTVERQNEGLGKGK
jgi:hypothetical protein